MTKQEMLLMRLEGKTYQEIALKANISRQRVQQLLSPPKQIRDIVIKKSEGLCSSCGIFVGKSGHVHHKGAELEENYQDIENLELLCCSCHRKAHSVPLDTISSERTFEIITAYQNSRKPPLTDADLARLWEVNQSHVYRIKKGEQMPGNKTWPKIRKNTPELYVALQKHYFSVAPEPHQTSQDGRGGLLKRVLRYFHLGR
jgi:hypothetical protein